MAIVKDKMIYHDENKKPMGYDIKSGRKLLKTDTLMNFTRQGQHKEGYARKKKTKKTQKVQYAEDDNHPVQKRIFGNSGIILVGKDGSVSGNSSATLSGSILYLCFTTINPKCTKLSKIAIK